MRRKQLQYGFYGLLLGGILGILVGIGELNYIKKGIRNQAALPVISLTVVVLSVAGISYGRRLGKEAYIEDTLGMNTITVEYEKIGRYWEGVMQWTDKRNNKTYLLRIAKGETGFLHAYLSNNKDAQKSETRLNEKSASKETVPKTLRYYRMELFTQLKAGYTEEPQAISIE
jgi:hypothetical protein